MSGKIAILLRGLFVSVAGATRHVYVLHPQAFIAPLQTSNDIVPTDKNSDPVIGLLLVRREVCLFPTLKVCASIMCTEFVEELRERPEAEVSGAQWKGLVVCQLLIHARLQREILSYLHVRRGLLTREARHASIANVEFVLRASIRNSNGNSALSICENEGGIHGTVVPHR